MGGETVQSNDTIFMTYLPLILSLSDYLWLGQHISQSVQGLPLSQYLQGFASILLMGILYRLLG